MPYLPVRPDLLDHASRLHALGPVQEHVAAGARGVVALLEQEPRRLAVLVASLHPNEEPLPLQLLPVQLEREPSLAESLVRIAHRGPGATVPQQHRSASVLALGYGPFEIAVLDLMVLDFDRESLVGWIAAGPLGHRPALEHAVQLEAEVVVEVRRGVLLDHVH